MNPFQNAPSVPVRLSNEVEDFASGGLYSGGRGVVKSCRYQLHDYNGKQAKDSNTGVFITFQPTDGSNENKPVELFWNVGPANEIIPDMASQGGFPVALHGKTGINDNSNAAKYLFAKLRSTCGLEKGKLSGPTGIHALEGSEIFFAQQDQEDRDFPQEQQPGQQPGQGQRRQKNKTYVPTYARFAWETGAARMPAPAQAPAPTQTMGVAAPHQVPPANGNGTTAGGVSPDLLPILKSLGTIDLSANAPKAVLDYCMANNINNPQRMAVVKEATALFKDSAALQVLAASNGWTMDGGILMVM